jgi:hypothetical protein
MGGLKVFVAFSVMLGLEELGVGVGVYRVWILPDWMGLEWLGWMGWGGTGRGC